MKKIVYVGMGGTIAGRADSDTDNVGYTAGAVGIASLLSAVPSLQSVLEGCLVQHEQLASIDSKDMTHHEWLRLANRLIELLRDSDVQSVVVTHGTDTLEETAYFLSKVLPADLIRAKPVVLTCAMRPASSAFADGPRNLVDASVVARTPGACGVVVVCAGYVHDGPSVIKDHPYDLDAFSSGERGALGVVEEGAYRALRPWAIISEPANHVATDFMLPTLPWPRVEIVMSYTHADGSAVRSLCAYQGTSPLRGLVVAGTGNGTFHKDLELAVTEAIAAGIRVVLVTRCNMGSIVGTPYGASLGMEVMSLPPAKARIALLLRLLGLNF